MNHIWSYARRARRACKAAQARQSGGKSQRQQSTAARCTPRARLRPAPDQVNAARSCVACSRAAPAVSQKKRPTPCALRAHRSASAGGEYWPHCGHYGHGAAHSTGKRSQSGQTPAHLACIGISGGLLTTASGDLPGSPRKSAPGRPGAGGRGRAFVLRIEPLRVSPLRASIPLGALRWRRRCWAHIPRPDGRWRQHCTASFSLITVNFPAAIINCHLDIYL